MKKRKKKNILLLVLPVILQLAALYFIKYSNQDLRLSEFRIGFIGNSFLAIIYIGLIAGLLFGAHKSGERIDLRSSSFYVFITWLMIVLAFISTKVDPGLNRIYLFGQAGNKLFTGLLFTFFLLSLFSFLIGIWGNTIAKRKISFSNSFYGSILMLLILLLLTYIYSTVLSSSSGRWKLEKNSSNIAVVLGAAVWSGNLPSPTLAARVDKALELVNGGFAGRILLTGSSAPGEMTEAEVALSYLLAKGADTSIVSVETLSTSTTGQIKFIKRELSDLENTGDIIVISDYYHLPRVIEIGRFLNVEIKVAESGHLIDFQDQVYNRIRESIALFIFWCFAL